MDREIDDGIILCIFICDFVFFSRNKYFGISSYVCCLLLGFWFLTLRFVWSMFSKYFRV